MDNRWRWAFAISGGLILIGGPMHPGGTMEQMLADPNWLPGHLLVLGGFLALLVGLILLRGTPRGAAISRVLRLAIAAAVLQSIEMFLHAIAVLDLEHLKAGQSTPVLTTHLTIAVVIYPLFAIALIAFIVADLRAKAVG